MKKYFRPYKVFGLILLALSLSILYITTKDAIFLIQNGMMDSLIVAATVFIWLIWTPMLVIAIVTLIEKVE